MNRFLFLLLLFLSAKIHAQLITREQSEAYANELVKNGFLTAKGQNILLQQIKKSAIEIDHPSTTKLVTYVSKDLSKETILKFCADALNTELVIRLQDNKMAIEEKISPKEPLGDSLEKRMYRMMDRMGGSKEYVGCITPQTSTLGYTRTKTLTTFLRSGLIDEKVFNDCEAALKTGQLRDEIELLRFMVNRSTYYRFYDFNKKEQADYILSLVQHGILTEQGKQNLLQSYKGYELKKLPDILKESERYTLVDLHAYKPDPKLTYPVIFGSVMKLFPEFHFSNLNVQVEEHKDGELIRQDVRLSFMIDTVRYSHLFFHDFRKPKPTPDDPDDEPSRVDQDFHKVINKWLTDMASPFRLYTINICDDDEGQYGGRSVGLLKLKKGEDSLITTDVYVISRESFDQGLSRKNVEKLVIDLSKQGLFNHLTHAEIDSSNEQIATKELSTIKDVLLQFPRTIVAFDWESGNLDDPYKQLTKEFMAASRGAFKVTNITDEFKKGWKNAKKVKYGFTMNGKRYEKMLTFQGDWLDPAFLEMLRLALSENKVNGRIYDCINDGQNGGYIFLTPDQYQFIQEAYPDLLRVDEF